LYVCCNELSGKAGPEISGNDLAIVGALDVDIVPFE
jgi:hypothetical protein